MAVAKSAEQALAWIVTSRNLARRDVLQWALEKAAENRISLEEVLVRAKVISQADCAAAVAIRDSWGRACSACRVVRSDTLLFPDANAERLRRC